MKPRILLGMGILLVLVFLAWMSLSSTFAVELVLQGHTKSVYCLSFSSSGTIIASGSADGTVKLWDAARGTEICTFSDHRRSVLSVAFASQGTLLASSGLDSTIRLWDVEKQTQVWSIKETVDGLWAVAFSPDQRTLAFVACDRYDQSKPAVIRLVDVHSGKVYASLKADDGFVYSISFSRDGKLLAAGGRYTKRVVLWNMQTLERCKSLDPGAAAADHVLFLPCGRLLVVAPGDGSAQDVRVYNIVNQELHASLRGHTRRIAAVACSPDGKLLAVGGGDPKPPLNRGEIRVWDLQERTLMKVLETHEGWAYSVAFSPNGKLLASGGKEGNIIIWKVQ